MTHPDDVLFEGERQIPVLPSCEHFAGSEKLIDKALELQARLGTFDVTMDLEDGAQAGGEKQHAEMVVAKLEKTTARAGVRIHDPTHASWESDLDIVVGAAGAHLAYVTLPKVTSARQAEDMIRHLQARAGKIGREIPVHVLIETHGALREVQAIAALPWVETLDFGLMDFIAAHGGAIPASAMRSPGQFEHRLVARAKAEICAAALGHGLVPSHNVTLDLKDPAAAFSDAQRARRELGFLRMWSIHPVQIEPITKAMAPDFAEVARGSEILLAAQKADWGPIQHAGQLHDRATYRYHWHLLQRARLAGMEISPDAEAAFFGDEAGGR